MKSNSFFLNLRRHTFPLNSRFLSFEIILLDIKSWVSGHTNYSVRIQITSWYKHVTVFWLPKSYSNFNLQSRKACIILFLDRTVKVCKNNHKSERYTLNFLWLEKSLKFVLFIRNEFPWLFMWFKWLYSVSSSWLSLPLIWKKKLLTKTENFHVRQFQDKLFIIQFCCFLTIKERGIFWYIHTVTF